MLSDSREKRFIERKSCLISLAGNAHDLIENLNRGHISNKFPILYPKKSSVTERKSYSRTRATDSRILALNDDMRYLECDMEEISLGRLLSTKFQDCCSYIERLGARIADSKSRILITGDVNSGKSTFGNALLRSSILPSDEQPCTQAFCEVCFSRDVNSIKIKAFKDVDIGGSNCSATSFSLSEMQEAIQEEDIEFHLFKIHVPINPGSTSSILAESSSMDISFIDSPGLNSDIFKTMSLFSKQEDIDVIVFLINAANHLTLSAREFLETASKEKTYIFIVINKFEDIRNKEKCKRMILSQIQEVLPKTYEEQRELIHFISARTFLQNVCTDLEQNTSIHNDVAFRKITENHYKALDATMDKEYDWNAGFLNLEQCLRSFILEKRTKSKLLPAKTYLLNVLEEVSSILEYNITQRSKEYSQIVHELEIISPCYEELAAHNGIIHADLNRTAEDTCGAVYSLCQQSLKKLPYKSIINIVPWLGPFGVFQFKDRVHYALTKEAKVCFDQARGASVTASINGLEGLFEIAKSHAREVFKNSSTEKGKDNLYKSLSGVPCDVSPPGLAPFDIIDYSWEYFTRSSSWISAIMLAGTTLGYQHIVSLALKFLDLSRGSRKLVGVAVVTSVGVMVLGTVLADLESMVRTRLERHYSSFFCSTEWFSEPARKLENLTRALLTMEKDGLLAKYDTALHRQRDIRAEKDISRHQVEAYINYLRNQSRVANALIASLNACQLDDGGGQ